MWVHLPTSVCVWHAHVRGKGNPDDSAEPRVGLDTSGPRGRGDRPLWPPLLAEWSPGKDPARMIQSVASSTLFFLFFFSTSFYLCSLPTFFNFLGGKGQPWVDTGPVAATTLGYRAWAALVVYCCQQSPFCYGPVPTPRVVLRAGWCTWATNLFPFNMGPKLH